MGGTAQSAANCRKETKGEEMTKRDLWQRYCRNLCVCEQVGLQLDISRMAFENSFLEQTANTISRAMDNMEALEKGSIANPDEKRMVGHYWLRNPDLAPEPEITTAINECVSRIKTFSENVHSGKISPPSGGTYKNLVIIGIGGSALGPQFVNDALGGANAKMQPFFCDNTDPDGIDRTLASIGDGLKETLALVISKSGGTKETRNGMLEIMRAYQSAGLDFAKHAVAVTGDGSDLHKTCQEQGWIDSFPMWGLGGRQNLANRSRRSSPGSFDRIGHRRTVGRCPRNGRHNPLPGHSIKPGRPAGPDVV